VAQFEITHESVGDILYVRVVGSPELSHFADHVYANLTTWQNHNRVLWDLRDFEFPAQAANGVREVGQAFSQILKIRKGGATALLVKDQNGLGLVRLLTSHLELTNAAVLMRGFVSLDQAENWLVSVV
jgi:hypothetical protein